MLVIACFILFMYHFQCFGYYLKIGQRFHGKNALILRRNAITSQSNEKVKFMKALMLQKKKRDESGLIILEGHRQIIDALDFGVKASCIFVSERAIQSPSGPKLFQLLDLISQNGLASVEDVDDSIIQSLSDTIRSQGVIASFERPVSKPVLTVDRFKNASPLILVLDRLQDPGNLGTLIRSAYGFAADAVVAVECCDAFSPKAIRSSMGLNLRIPIYETSWKGARDLLEGFRKDVYSIIDEQVKLPKKQLQILLADAAEPYSNGISRVLAYHDVDFSRCSVVIIGSEGSGLGPDAKDYLDAPGWAQDSQIVTIPFLNEAESLNAAVAGSIILSEAYRQRYHQS